jgi:hypothetical protein
MTAPLLLTTGGILSRDTADPAIFALHYGFWLLQICIAIRLGIAYRYYLRFDHAFATTAASQFIVMLLYATCMARGWI